MSNALPTQVFLARVLEAAPFHVPYDDFPHQDIILYGGGRLGKMAYGLLTKAGVRIAYVIDKHASALADDFPVPVLTPEAAAEQLPHDAFIFNCAFKIAPGIVEKALKELGFTHIYTIYDYLYAVQELHFTNGWHTGTLSDEDKENIAYVYHHLADDSSRAAYLHNVNWRVSRTLLPLDSYPLISEDDKYFNTITVSTALADSTLLDVGTFDLFFTLQALDPVLNPYPPAHIIAYEPDPESYARCTQILAQCEPAIRKRITLSSLAVSHTDGGKNMIGGNDLASRLVDNTALTGKETGILHVRTATLDTLCANLKNVSYIKLHVEGEELQCLQGGIDSLQQHRPVIVANCSHNRDGLWKIAHFAMQHLEDYRFYFRAHANYGEGLSFYAVPNPSAFNTPAQ